MIIGKTHVPELMATPFTESPTFGVTRNPWDPHRTSGGSSGGSRHRGRGRPGERRARHRRRRLDPDSGRLRAGCSGSSRSAGGSRPRRRSIRTGGMTVFGPLTRTVADAARFIDAVTDGGPSLTEAAATRAGAAADRGLHRPPAAGCQPRRRAARRGRVDRRARCANSATRSASGSSTGELTIGNRVIARFVRGIGDTRDRPRSPRAALAASPWAGADRRERSRRASPTPPKRRPRPTPSG